MQNSERRPAEVLVVGAGRAGQRIYLNKLLNTEFLGPDLPTPRITMYDPRIADIPLIDELQGSEDLFERTEELPQNKQFDLAVIATATGEHMTALDAVLHAQERQPDIIVEKPFVVNEHEEYHFMGMLKRLDTDRVYVHDPYLLLNGLQAFQNVLRTEESTHNPATEIHAWTCKLRRKFDPHAVAGPYGVELPHTHAAASALAGVILGPEHITKNGHNTHFAGTNDMQWSEATMSVFEPRPGLMVHVAQGLGHFVFNDRGVMKEVFKPPVARSLAAKFKDGSRLVLDVNSAFTHTPGVQRHTALWRENSEGEVQTASLQIIPDYPIQKLLRVALGRLHGLSQSSLPDIGPEQSLARCITLRKLRETAKKITNTTIEPLNPLEGFGYLT